MKRIIVIGCPGSGKSTFAKKLNSATGIPLFHLDMLYWNKDKTTVEKSVFLERLRNALNGDSWIIDGNYASTMDERVAACDTVFFLDLSAEICLEGVKERRGKERSDMPWTETEEDTELTAFINSYNNEERPRVLSLLEKYSNKSVTIFKSREEADAYLSRITEKEDR